MSKMVNLPHLPCLLWLIPAAVLIFFASGCSLAHHNYALLNTAESPATVYVPQTSLPLPPSPASKKIQSIGNQSLNLAHCIKIALEQNPETRAAWQAARSAAAGVGEAKSSYLPSAEFSGSAIRSALVNLDSQEESRAADTFEAELGIRYLLFNGGARPAALKKAEAALLSANFQHNTAIQKIILMVEEAYYQLLAAKELEQVAKQTIRQTQYHVDIARARHKNGIVAKSDILKAETKKAEADLELVIAQSQIRISHGQLASAMGLPPSQSFEITELPKIPQQQELADIKRLMADAAANRPELSAALAEIESKRAGISAAKALYWPEVTLNTAYGQRDRSFYPDRDEWSFALGISWPLFTGFKREYGIQQAKSDLAKTDAEYEKLLRGVELEVWTAYSQLIEAGQATEAAQALVSSAEESARVVEGEYKNGAASIIEVTDAQTARSTANVRLVQTRLDWYTAMAHLEQAMGRQTAQGGQSIQGE